MNARGLGPPAKVAWRRGGRRPARSQSVSSPKAGEDVTRDRIVATAFALFRHYGHTKTTLADIAAACEMSRANVYRFFDSKSAISETICTLVLTGLAADLAEIAAGAGPASARLARMADRVTRFNRDGARSDERIHDMLASAVAEDWSAVRRFVHDARILFASVVGDGMATGEFAEGDPGRVALYMCFALIGFWHPSVVDRCSEFAEVRDASELVAFLLSGLRPDRHPAEGAGVS